MEFPHVRFSCRAAVVDMQFLPGSSPATGCDDYDDGTDRIVNYVKELAFCRIDSNDMKNYLFKPPHDEWHQSERAVKQSEFVRERINGLDWNDGDVSYDSLRETVCDLVEENDVAIIYVKGDEKRKILIELLESTPAVVNVYDLVEFGCPRLDLLPIYEVECDMHENPYYRCASHNVYRLLLWIISKAAQTRAKFPEYRSRSSRWRSFETFPLQLAQKRREMVNDGFFYTGLSDRVVCHHCGVAIGEWSEFDRPREKHQNRSSDCGFLKATTR